MQNATEKLKFPRASKTSVMQWYPSLCNTICSFHISHSHHTHMTAGVYRHMRQLSISDIRSIKFCKNIPLKCSVEEKLRLQKSQHFLMKDRNQNRFFLFWHRNFQLLRLTILDTRQSIVINRAGGVWSMDSEETDSNRSQFKIFPNENMCGTRIW